MVYCKLFDTQKKNEKHLNIKHLVQSTCEHFIFLVYIELYKLPSKIKLLMESCHTLFMEKLVIGLSHFISMRMVCEG
jgi:hypothetical protein